MADNANRDLVNLDEEALAQDTGAGASNGDTIINAAEMFQQQLEQMTQWKTQLSTQMEAMRADGIKLLERQKNLAVEKKRLAEERTDLGAKRQQLEQLRSELEGQSQKLSQRAGELEQAQQRLIDLQQQREQAERELAARQKSLTEQEARHLAEDVRLREGLEQLEGERRHLLDLQRQAALEHEKLEAEGRALAERARQLDQQSQSVAGREQEVAAGRQGIAQAQAELKQRQDDLSQHEAALAEKIRITGQELDARATALLASEQELAGERQAFACQKQELRARLEAFEREQAEQLEALATQTKRLSQRRTEVETAENDLAKTLETRIAQATLALQEELAQARGGHDLRVQQLEAELTQAASATQTFQQREAQFQQELSGTSAQLAAVKSQLAALQAELHSATTAAEQLTQERSALSQKLAQQIESAREEAAQWQKALDEARTQSAGGNQALEAAQQQNDALRKDVKKLKAKAQELQSAKDELEFQLEVRKEDFGKQLEAQRQELTQQISARDAEIADAKQKLAEAQSATPASAAASDPQNRQRIEALTQQAQVLTQQRDELAGRLSAVQDALRHQEEEALLARSAMEGRLQELEQKNTTLEAEKTTWQSKPQAAPVIRIVPGNSETPGQRERLLRQAKALRHFRLQIRDTQAALESGRAELAQQREQMRARKENLEQVKRLLEKQEMVMARKLADHNAIKTVAAVGIFVIMVLGGAFLGVYRFVHPVYRSEAVVQLVAPQDLKGAELDTWLSRQMDFMRSTEVTFAAWKVLRSGDEHYVMHDVRDEWMGSLPTHMTLTVDAGSKTLSVRYTGPDAQGVSQVCNALATAYATPGLRDSSDPNKALGLGASVLAQAAPPAYPVEDNRMMVSLGIVAGTLFVSLLLVMIFRHFIARQLKEIDQMADAQELEDMHGELPENPAPQA